MGETPGKEPTHGLDDIPFMDVRGEAYRENPFRELEQFRDQCPFLKSERGVEVLRHEWLADVGNHPGFLTGGYGVRGSTGPLDKEFAEHGLLIAMGGEKHDRIRKVLAKAFSIRTVDQQRGMMRDVSTTLVDHFIDKGECEFVEDFSHHFSINVICRLLGVPVQDIPRFDRATTVVGAVGLDVDPARKEAALGLLRDYVEGLVADRRKNMTADYVSAVIEAQQTEGRLSEKELVWSLVNLLFAGHETTRFQLASVVRVIVQQEPLWERLAAAPELIPAALDEAQRLFPASQLSSRHAPQDIEYRGYVIPAGTAVRLNRVAANRDPEVYPNPHVFDMNRDSSVRNISFGWGYHHCLGANLARAEMCEALGVLTSRLKDVRIAGEAVVLPPLGGLGGTAELPLAFSAR